MQYSTLLGTWGYIYRNPVAGLTIPIYHYTDSNYSPTFDIIVVGDSARRKLEKVDQGYENRKATIGHALSSPPCPESPPLYFYFTYDVGYGRQEWIHEGIVTDNLTNLTSGCNRRHEFETIFYLPTFESNITGTDYCGIGKAYITYTFTINENSLASPSRPRVHAG